MSLKENPPIVKPEPVEHSMPLADATFRANNASISAQEPVVKPEPLGLSIPSVVVAPKIEPAPIAFKPENQEDTKKGLSDKDSQAHPVVFQQGSLKAVVPAIANRYNRADEISYTPENSLSHGLELLKNLKAHVSRLELGSRLRKDVWLREIVNLENQGSPSTMIAVCGATGAGKSSILNAILDDNIVPTSGMRACTAVVTEIAYHREKSIAADVSFLSEKEWREELEVLLEDMVDEDGTLKRSTDLRNEAGVAWHKVHALYPKLMQERLIKMTVDQILNSDQLIKRLLGTVKKIVAKDSRDFAKQISKYIDSKDQKRGKKDKIGDPSRREDKADGPALWPLIRQVNVRCSAEALRTGAVLVDLPGVADANAARSSIAKDYMKKCNCVWILAPITRAVDDKTAKDLLGDAFKSQLMNGSFADVESTITFIATKCDDISCSEVIRALQLEDDPELEEIEDRIQIIQCETREWKDKKQQSEKAAKDIMEEMSELRADLAEHQTHLKALEDGESFTPTRTSKAKEQVKNGKKRKNTRSGKKGSVKRLKSSDFVDDDDLDEDMDDLDDFIVDDDEPVSDADNDSNSDKDSASDRDSDDEYKADSDNAMSKNSDDERYNVELDPSEPIVVDAEDGNAEDVITEEVLNTKVEKKRAEIKAAREKLSEARKQRKEAIDTLSTLEKKKVKAQRDKNAFCSLKRSEFSRDVLKEDFRAGLKELDDAAAEKSNPDTFDPTVNLRDYSAVSLPTFTCSSRDYIRLTKQVKGDGDPTCFSNVEDTGVPALQKWCHTLTLTSRERAARSFRTQLRTFAASIQSYVDNIGKVKEDDRIALREKWQTPAPEYGDDDYDTDDEEDNYDDDSDEDPDLDAFLRKYHGGVPMFSMKNSGKAHPRRTATNGSETIGITGILTKAFNTVVTESVKGMQAAFRRGLEEKCQVGAESAIASAVNTSDYFAASMYWSTYRATLRRNGTWRRDLNEELITPMTRSIASTWATVFESDLFAPFDSSTTAAINELLKDFEGSCALGLRDRSRNQAELCLREATATLKKTLAVVREELNTRQKDVSRSLVPHVQEQLLDGYARAMEERGRGSVARQKAVFHDYVDANKEDLFEGGAETVLERLDKVAEAVGDALKLALAGLAEKVEVNLSVLWEGVKDDPEQRGERAATMEDIKVVLNQLRLWDAADRLRR